MKSVLITGSTSGIGLGMAHAFAAQGYAIMFNGLESNGKEIADAVAKQYNVKTDYHPANMLQPEEIKDMVAKAEEAFGGLHVVINNAGIQHVAPIEDFPDNKWNDIIGITLSSAFHICKAVWPGFKARKFGRVINLTSAHALRASPFKVAYIAAKHGVTGLTKTLALEGAEFGITVNAICPGYVKTPLVDKQIADQAAAYNIPEDKVVSDIILKKQAIKEFVGIPEIAALALFLASPDAKMITGTSIPIDGGWTAQ